MKISITLAALAAALGLALLPDRASALVIDGVVCPTTSTEDFDGDGFTDAQECAGLLLADGNVFPGVLPLPDGAELPRAGRLDPNSMDLFVIYRRVNGGLLDKLPNPFEPLTFHNISFRGLSALGITVHVLYDDTGAFATRRVSPDSTQLAVRVSESLDTGGEVLGNCQWGTPLGLDGCLVFTQRAKNLIDSKCSGDPVAVREQVFLAYATFLALHETGHSLGGLAAEYNSRFGGYHYKAGSGVIMEEAATYSAKQGRCTWYISSGWNMSLDPGAVRLK